MSKDWLAAEHQAIEPSIKEAIIKLALKYHIMTAFTSFVAVDETSKTGDEKAQRKQVALDWPDGLKQPVQNFSEEMGGSVVAPGSYTASNYAASNYAASNYAASSSSFAPSSSYGAMAPSMGYSGLPQLQEATNGTIGPQGADATFVTGVNTAGMVRVNNLVNLEALLTTSAALLDGLTYALVLVALTE